MISAIIGVVGIVIGTILGFVLNEIARWWREKRAEKKQIRAVRTMLSLEIDQNLALLRDFWSKTKDVDLPEDKPDRHNLILVRRLSESPLPLWSHKMWESQMPLLATALSEEEIKQVHRHHNKLDAITAIRTQLSTLKEERHQYSMLQHEKSKSTEPLTRGMEQVRSHFSKRKLEKEFCEKASLLWEGCEQIVGDLKHLGNPLQIQKQCTMHITTRSGF